MAAMSLRRPLAVELAVSEAAGVNAREHDRVRDNVAGYLSQLLSDLDAPVDVTVSVRAATEQDTFLPGEVVRVFANGIPLRSRLQWFDGEATPVQPAALARRISQDLYNQRAALVSTGQGATAANVELASLAVRASRVLAGDSSGDHRVLIDNARDAAARLELHCSPANRLLVARVLDEEVPDSTSLKLLIDVYFEDQVPDATIAPKLNDVRAPLIVGSDEDDGIGLDAGLEKGLRRFLRSSLAALVSRGWVGFLLGRLSGSHPTLVTQFRQRFENEALARVLRELVAEGLRVDDVRMILDSLLAAHGAIALADYESYVLRPNDRRSRAGAAG